LVCILGFVKTLERADILEYDDTDPSRPLALNVLLVSFGEEMARLYLKAVTE